MSILSRIWHFFGMNTVSLELIFPDELPRSAGEARGSLTITARSPQVIQAARITLLETPSYTGNRPGVPLTFEMGSVALLSEPVSLAAGEVRMLDFVMPYILSNPEKERSSDPEEALRDKPQIRCDSGSFFQAIATVELEGVSINPLKSKNVRLV